MHKPIRCPGRTTIIKPGSAGRPGGWTGPGLIKDRLWQKPGQTRATRRVDPEPGRDPVFLFFQMWDLKPISIYTLCSHEKNHVFSMRDLKPISIYTLCSHEKNHVFSMWDKKPFGLNTST